MTSELTAYTYILTYIMEDTYIDGGTVGQVRRAVESNLYFKKAKNWKRN